VTDIIIEGEGRFRTDLSASYLLVSRRLAKGRVSLRGDVFSRDDDTDHAVTVAYFWTPRGKLRSGIEAIIAGEEKRVAVELRYSFAGL
jgi:hypothetical protein